jgi:predicted acetyltransferase
MHVHPLPQLRIDRASAADEPVFMRLFQLYFHDFSDWSGEDVDDQGRFDAWDPGTFAADSGSTAHLLRMDGRLAGFLVVETVDTPGGPMTEFADLFVLRKYRGGGVAMEVVRRMMVGSGHPWLVAVFRRDAQALAFWQKAFARLPLAVREFPDPGKPQYRFFAIGGDSVEGGAGAPGTVR